jgi:hypothetical protein
VGRLRRTPERPLPRVPSPDDFTSPLRGPRTASRVGLWLGVCFGLAFLTGLYSHVAQLSDPAIPVPTGPVWFYRVTQGVHVAAGSAAVPLLVVKLWSVYPRLFVRPPRELRRLVLHALERGSIAVLVASAVFQLATGLANSAQWYPWGFTFRLTHFSVAWVAIGALLIHVAVKLPVIREAFGTRVGAPEDAAAGALSRRSLLAVTWLAAGLAVLTTAGSAVPALRRISVFGVRSGEGPSGIPINKSAAAAGVLGAADDPAYVLTVRHGERELVLTRKDLEALPQASATLPIACVEGWSASGTWTGVRVRDLVERVGGSPDAGVIVRSLQARGAYAVTRLPANFASHPDTLLALSLAGEPLNLDHGYPCRIIAPNRPGVLQTKWVARLEVEA